MSWLSQIGGMIPGVGRFLDPSRVNRFRAQQAPLDLRQYGPDISQAQQNVQNVFGQQQGLAGLLSQQGMGQGPNPALEMLRQQTGQNVMGAQGFAASQRGVNPAVRAMLGGQAGAQAQQQSIGQGAIMSAQQQLAARQQLAQLLASMGGQQAGMYGTAGGLQQGQNMAQIANVMGAQQINAAVAAQNAQFLQNLIGGGLQAGGGALNLLGGGGAGAGAGMGAAALAAHGGEVPGYRLGGLIGGDSLYEDLNAMMPGPYATMDQSMPPVPAPQTLQTPVGPTGMPDVTGIGGATPPPAPTTPKPTDWGGMMKSIGAGLTKPTMGDFDRFMHMRIPGTLAQGGITGLPDYRGGGPVPGEAPYPGDDERNDTVHIAASPGEIVIPRTAAQGPDAPEKARNFVEHLMRHQGLGYDQVLQSRKKYQEGGKVAGSEPEPSLWEAVKSWWATKGGTPEAQAKGKDVAEAINAVLPEAVSARSGVKAQRKRQEAAYEASKSE